MGFNKLSGLNGYKQTLSFQKERFTLALVYVLRLVLRTSVLETRWNTLYSTFLCIADLTSKLRYRLAPVPLRTNAQTTTAFGSRQMSNDDEYLEKLLYFYFYWVMCGRK